MSDVRSIVAAVAWLLFGLGLGALSTRPVSTASLFPWSVTPYVFVFLWAMCSTIGAVVAIALAGRVRGSGLGAVIVGGAMAVAVGAQWLSTWVPSAELMVTGYAVFALATSFVLVVAAGTAADRFGRAAVLGGFVAASVAAPALAITAAGGSGRGDLLALSGPDAEVGWFQSWSPTTPIGPFGDNGQLGLLWGIGALVIGSIVLVALYRWSFASTAILAGRDAGDGSDSRADEAADDLASLPFMIPALTFSGISAVGVLVLSLVPDLMWAAYAVIAGAGILAMTAVAWIWFRSKATPWMVWFAVALGAGLPLVVAVGHARGLTLIALVAAPAVVSICWAAADRGSAVRAAFLLACAGLWYYAPTAASWGLLGADWSVPVVDQGSVQYMYGPHEGDLSTVYAQLGFVVVCLVIGATSLYRHRGRDLAPARP